MNSIYTTLVSALIISGMMMLGKPLLAETITVTKLASAPTLDGSDRDWQGIEPTVLQLHKSGEKVTVGVKSISLKAGIVGDEVYLFIQWEDATKDDQHKPFVWDAAKNKYVAGPQMEDRLALQFEMAGEYTVNWMSGQSFQADTWHWKAARSNPMDLMQDKMTIIGTDPVKKAYSAQNKNGTTIYIQRPSDKGDKFYTTKRYSSKDKDMMPKYILATNPQGSIADVHCKGVWKDGKWNLEVRRKLDTGHPDDVIFAKGNTIKAGMAVFDHSGDDDHVISDTLTFQF
jgi:hypothetical protein